jgi:hypothetical protein
MGTLVPMTCGKKGFAFIPGRKEKTMKLEEQLAKLSEFGLPLNDGITIDDVLYSFDRESYEKDPFDLILFILGVDVEREPWDRHFCPRAWNFDTECICAEGDYSRIVRRLGEISGKTQAIDNITDRFSPSSKKNLIEYTINGARRRFDISVNGNWADMETLHKVMRDMETDDCHFYFKDNGQAMILYYLRDDHARELISLTNGAVKRSH